MRKAKFDVASYDFGKYEIVRTTADLRQLDRDTVPQTILHEAKERREFTEMTLTLRDISISVRCGLKKSLPVRKRACRPF